MLTPQINKNMNLYTFSKNSWHVKFYTWLFDTNPTQKFKTMCPYFWTYVLIFLTLPLLLLGKMMGKSLYKLDDYYRDKKEQKVNSIIEKLAKQCENCKSDEEAYLITELKCFDKYEYYLDYDLRKTILEKSYNFKKQLYKKEEELEEISELKKIAIQEKIDKITNNIFIKVLSNILFFSAIIVAISFILFLLFFLIPQIPYIFWNALVIIIGLLSTVILLAYILSKIIDKIKFCDREFKYLKLFFKYLFIPFKFLFGGMWKFICIIGHMIYSTYKKQCPIITWED